MGMRRPRTTASTTTTTTSCYGWRARLVARNLSTTLSASLRPARRNSWITPRAALANAFMAMMGEWEPRLVTLHENGTSLSAQESPTPGDPARLRAVGTWMVVAISGGCIYCPLRPGNRLLLPVP